MGGTRDGKTPVCRDTARSEARADNPSGSGVRFSSVGWPGVAGAAESQRFDPPEESTEPRCARRARRPLLTHGRAGALGPRGSEDPT